MISPLIFIRRSLMDVSKAYKIYFTNKKNDEGQILARNLIVHLSEFISDIGKFIGSPLTKWIKSVELDKFLNSDVKKLRTQFNDIKKYFAEINSLRNSIGAHKEKDIIKQIQELDRLSNVEIDKIFLKIQIAMHLFEIVEIQLFDALENKIIEANK
jgi:hypothetical protein